MVQHDSFDSPNTTLRAEPRVKKGAGIVVLLVLMTLANALVLVLGVVSWVDEVDHGAEWGDGPLRLVVLLTSVSVVAVVGLLGAWFTRKWGPRLYVLTAGFSLLFGLLVSGGAGFSPLNLVGLGLAVGLWLHAEAKW
ncbi:hypothetical protein [Saccharothrix texasensis]|uniref:Uncharacterized protein n=1 Tax=Saccharothrix texasensis TaxID=103734 RepID=A0A3N1HIR1_9PSEU|nr:hypothetical protein [Saccharothrix texasensis]ROP42355.1 hypothetical protein EDD40_7854 [Saccharothrix texasensis]